MRYAHLADDPVKQAAEENAARLEALVNPVAEQAYSLRIVT